MSLNYRNNIHCVDLNGHRLGQHFNGQDKAVQVLFPCQNALHTLEGTSHHPDTLSAAKKRMRLHTEVTVHGSAYCFDLIVGNGSHPFATAYDHVHSRCRQDRQPAFDRSTHKHITGEKG